MRKRRFGQHFLEPAWARRVVRAIDAAPGDPFLEIGPGRGALTRPLLAACGRVVAIEIDRDLAAALRAEERPGLTLIEADFLALSTSALRQALALGGLVPPIRVAGNLPYNVAAPILFALRDHHAAGLELADATVMVQREVADRLTAHPGTRDYGVLTVLVGHRAAVQRLLELPAGAFRPPPKVRSTVIRLEFHDPDPAVADAPGFERMVKGLFSRRRKTLANALQGAGASPAHAVAILERTGLDGRRRPETLSIEALAAVANHWRPVL